jgi:hypothetical protein
LIFDVSILERTAEAGFQAVHGGLGETPAMITDRLLPDLPAVAANLPDALVARQRIGGRVTVPCAGPPIFVPSAFGS